MPVGIQRINAKKSQPNERIVFIKPLKGPDEAVAQDFLERIAAQCLPVMKEHLLSVMTLEEYEPNREFVGRNFNAGEVVQLVLKSPSTGRWLPFNYVQMVMMHELAHCKQMNHSKAFWAVRNAYADQMRTLMSRSYTGEGLWGKGTSLKTGEFEANTIHADDALPEHLCGGTYRSQRRKRKAKQQLSYQERKERRILKKFGANGVALGEDEDVKATLEKGKKIQGKPRVAGSKRGRELRAAAALARFDQVKKAEEVKKEEDDDETASNTGSETGSDAEEGEGIMDVNGRRLLDKKGHSLIKVCEDEDPEDGDAKNELRELSSMSGMKNQKPQTIDADDAQRTTSQKRHDSEETPEAIQRHLFLDKSQVGASQVPRIKKEPGDDNDDTSVDCPMCSFKNGSYSTICDVCAHVLDPTKMAGSWRCTSVSCRGSRYLNAGDSGVCGICGGRK